MINKLERIDSPILQLPSGDHLNLTLFRIKGDQNGPNIHIQANVHGAEIQGNAVILNLLKYFCHNSFNGTVTVIPTANPLAVNNKTGASTSGRFSQITGENWNRTYTDVNDQTNPFNYFDIDKFAQINIDLGWNEIKELFKLKLFQHFKNIEKKYRAKNMIGNKIPSLLLQKVASNADIVLDLHTGPKATNYIYSADHQSESVKNFNFPYVINIPPKFAGAMDEATFCPWVKLNKALLKIGKQTPIDFESYTIELGNEETINLENAKKSANNILNYLFFKQVINKQIKINQNKQIHCKLEDFVSYNAPFGGLYEFTRSPGEFVKKGEALAKYFNLKDIKSSEDLDFSIKHINADNDCYVINHGTSGSIMQGMEIYQVMESFNKVL